jgi:hypothetical protein
MLDERSRSVDLDQISKMMRLGRGQGLDTLQVEPLGRGLPIRPRISRDPRIIWLCRHGSA